MCIYVVSGLSPEVGFLVELMPQLLDMMQGCVWGGAVVFGALPLAW